MKRLVGLSVMLVASCSGPQLADPGPPRTQAPSVSPPARDTTQADAPAALEGLEPATAVASSEPVPELEPSPAPGPRLGSVGHYTWIYATASRSTQPIGFLRPGASTALRAAEPIPGSGCRGAWYAAEPAGFVCADGSTTLDMADPLLRALQEVNPEPGPFPYRYAYSLGAPMYGRIPTPEQQAQVERIFEPVHKLPALPKFSAGHEELATATPIAPGDPIPHFLLEGREAPRMRGWAKDLMRKEIPYGSLLSFHSAFESDGRTFLLSADLTVVPADRVRVFQRSQFHGAWLAEGLELPVAWTRASARPQYRSDDGVMVKTGSEWPPRRMLALTGGRMRVGGVEYVQTKEQGIYAKASDVSVVEAPRRVPYGVTGRDKWIDFSIGQGTLTLHEGSKAVFTTLASPGAGGAPPSSRMTVEELVKGSHTPLGVYRITYKTVATTMTPERVPNPLRNWIADVPHTMYFWQPFAIHAAYWHEDFGQPKSAGCINVSPRDAETIYGWSDPSVPGEWSGASSTPSALGTTVVIRR